MCTSSRWTTWSLRGAAFRSISEGKLVGAIGCSGGSGSQDEVVAKAGVAAFK